MNPEIHYRTAVKEDLGTLIWLLSDDALGATREHADAERMQDYSAAFDAISGDPNNQLVVAEREGTVIAVLQLTYIPNLTYTGSWRAQIEGVRVDRNERGRGVGRALVQHAIQLASERGCLIVQLTTDKRRPAALEFYRELGFEATHEGMKLWL
ncbi:MAG: GNAT family N-acetyltransferase [Rhodothermales bacterium]